MSLAQSALKKIFVQPIGYCQNCQLVVRSVGITTRQTYDNINKQFVPDYTDESSMLQIFPQCTMVNPDSPVASVVVNKELSDVTWWEVTTKGETKITASNTGYKITDSGDSKGEIFVKSNGTVGVPRTLRFKAKWYDTQSGYCYVFQKEIGLSIDDASEPMPELVLDIPKTFQWNPFRNTSTYKVTPTVFVGKLNVVDDARCKLFWYHIEDDGSKTLITSENSVPSLEISEVVKNENEQIKSLLFNLEMIRDSSYEVVASFRSKGSLPAEPASSDPRYQFSISRTYPAMTAEFRGKTLSVSRNEKTINLVAIIKDNMDVVPDWSKYACAYWYKSTVSVDQNNTTQQVNTLIGKGESINVAASEQDFIMLTLEDRGAYSPVVDDNSNYLVTDNGEYIVQNDIV